MVKGVLRVCFPWLLLALTLWSLFVTDSFSEALPTLGLLITAVIGYAMGVTDAQEGFVKFHTIRTVNTFEELLDDDDR